VTLSIRLRKPVGATISIGFPYDEYTVGTQERQIIAILRRFGGHRCFWRCARRRESGSARWNAKFRTVGRMFAGPHCARLDLRRR
jgi:hypothetical protein